MAKEVEKKTLPKEIRLTAEQELQLVLLTANVRLTEQKQEIARQELRASMAEKGAYINYLVRDIDLSKYSIVDEPNGAFKYVLKEDKEDENESKGLKAVN